MSATQATTDSRHPLLVALLLAVVVAAMNIGLWWWGNLPHGPDDWHGPVNGFSVSVFQRYQNPLKQDDQHAHNLMRVTTSGSGPQLSLM